MDTGIKTKIIKQYLPIMNKLINTYLTAMEFYVNFTLNENFEEWFGPKFTEYVDLYIEGLMTQQPTAFSYFYGKDTWLFPRGEHDEVGWTLEKLWINDR